MPGRRLTYVGNSAATRVVVGMAATGLAFLVLGERTADGVVARVLWLCLGLGWLTSAYLRWWTRVGFDDHGLVIRGPYLARRSVAWSDIAGFEVRRERRELGAKTDAGRWIHLQTFAKDQVDTAYAAEQRLDVAKRGSAA